MSPGGPSSGKGSGNDGGEGGLTQRFDGGRPVESWVGAGGVRPSSLRKKVGEGMEEARDDRSRSPNGLPDLSGLPPFPSSSVPPGLGKGGSLRNGLEINFFQHGSGTGP